MSRSPLDHLRAPLVCRLRRLFGGRSPPRPAVVDNTDAIRVKPLLEVPKLRSVSIPAQQIIGLPSEVHSKETDHKLVYVADEKRLRMLRKRAPVGVLD